MYLTKTQVVKSIENAIYNRIVLEITYDHTQDNTRRNKRKIAPFDLGTTNKKTYERNKDNLYIFCYEHFDKKTNSKKPQVHPISSLHIIEIVETEELFDPIELTNINYRNTKYDYRNCIWAIAKDRMWY